jgi:hypothetical protein
MTDEMMNLRTLLEKSSDADLLREMVGFTAQRLIGAAHPQAQERQLLSGLSGTAPPRKLAVV